MSTALASIQDVEAVSTSVPSSDLARVERAIELASARVIRYTGQQLAQVVDDAITITPHDGVARLPQHPVTAVTSITIRSALVDPTLYNFTANGYLKRLSPIGWNVGYDNGLGWATTEMYNPTGSNIDEYGWPPLPMDVVYTHGYAAGTLPDDIIGVVAELAAAKWLGGESMATNVVSETIDGYSRHLNKIVTTEAWSPEHKQILDAFGRRKFASVRLT